MKRSRDQRRAEHADATRQRVAEALARLLHERDEHGRLTTLRELGGRNIADEREPWDG